MKIYSDKVFVLSVYIIQKKNVGASFQHQVVVLVLAMFAVCVHMYFIITTKFWVSHINISVMLVFLSFSKLCNALLCRCNEGQSLLTLTKLPSQYTGEHSRTMSYVLHFPKCLESFFLFSVTRRKKKIKRKKEKNNLHTPCARLTALRLFYAFEQVANKSEIDAHRRKVSVDQNFYCERHMFCMNTYRRSNLQGWLITVIIR